MAISLLSANQYCNKHWDLLDVSGEKEEDLAEDVLIWIPTHGRQAPGLPKKKHTDQWMNDKRQMKETSMESKATLMMDIQYFFKKHYKNHWIKSP